MWNNQHTLKHLFTHLLSGGSLCRQRHPEQHPGICQTNPQPKPTPHTSWTLLRKTVQPSKGGDMALYTGGWGGAGWTQVRHMRVFRVRTDGSRGDRTWQQLKQLGWLTQFSKDSEVEACSPPPERDCALVSTKLPLKRVKPRAEPG